MYSSYSKRALTTEIKITPKTPLEALELRVIALETKLRFSKPEHPCDCKYELSLLEEKLGTLSAHPWEHRLAVVEEKQKRDVDRLSTLREEHDACSKRLDDMIGDYGWEDGERAMDPVNLVYVVDQMLQKMKEWDRFRKESERSLRILNRSRDKLKAGGYMTDVSQAVSAEVAATKTDTEELKKTVDKLVESTTNKAEEAELKRKVEELSEIKDQLGEDLNILSDRTEIRVKELEATIAYVAKLSTKTSNYTTSRFPWLQNYSDRNTWVPGTSSQPVNKVSYAQNIPLVLEQPSGWAEERAKICRDLEQSQEEYFNGQKQSDSVVATQILVENQLERGAQSDLGPVEDISKKRKKKKSKTKPRKTLDLTTEVPSEMVTSLELESNILSAEPLDELKSTDISSNTRCEDPIHASGPESQTSTSLSSSQQDENLPVLDTELAEKVAKNLSSAKSKSTWKNSKSKTITKGRNRPKQVPLYEIFKHGKSAGHSEDKFKPKSNQSEENRLINEQMVHEN